MSRPLGPIVVALAFAARAAVATPGDTTAVRTFDQDFYNWATPHYATFTFPADASLWNKVVILYTIGCPGTPNDCDPWDRLGHLRVVRDDGAETEIARIITPYDITGGAGPGTCTWEINVTPYKSILHGEVTLRNYIESWIGGNNGWLVTIDFLFIEGILDPEPYRVIDLWGADHLVYGDPDQPIDDVLVPVPVDIPADATEARVRVFTTGHGQGNTQNCAEFCPKNHSVVAGADTYSHLLWRSNCSQNTCSPQGGNWTFARAGWCPGDDARAWNVDVTPSLTPGQTMTFQYQIDAYENLCRPSNPQCVSGVTCDDCAYNSTGHTEPHYTTQAQLVLFKPRALVVAAGDLVARPAGLVLEQNVPNPAVHTTLIGYSIDRPGPVRLLVYDASGRLVREVQRGNTPAGEHSYRWDGRDAEGRRVAAGTFFYVVEAGGERQAKRLVILQ
ncbi:MAG: peptide-N-glycosidase F-related protein [bacterium]